MSEVPRIAVYGDAGGPFHHILVFARQGYEVCTVFAEEIRAGALAAFDVFVMPGGGMRAMQGQLAPLGNEGAAAIADFVRDGGMYLGSCAGAYNAADPAPAFQQVCPNQPLMRLLPARVWNEDREKWDRPRSPGIGRIRVRNDFRDHPIMAGLPREFDVVQYNGPIFAGTTSLLSIAGPTPGFTAREDFFGQPYAGERTIDAAAAESRSAAVVGRFGRGRVALFGCHPEFGFAPDTMADPQPPNQMLINAVEWQIDQSGPTPTPRATRLAATSHVATVPHQNVVKLIDEMIVEHAALSELTPDRPWISNRQAMSTFGRSAVDIWRDSVAAIPALLEEVRTFAPDLPAALLTFEPDPRSTVDFGYSGILRLLRDSHAMLVRARASWDIDLDPPRSHPYEHIDTNPYHLVAGSYLAAVGRITAAALLCRCPPGRVNV